MKYLLLILLVNIPLPVFATSGIENNASDFLINHLVNNSSTKYSRLSIKKVLNEVDTNFVVPNTNKNFYKSKIIIHRQIE